MVQVFAPVQKLPLTVQKVRDKAKHSPISTRDSLRHLYSLKILGSRSTYIIGPTKPRKPRILFSNLEVVVIDDSDKILSKEAVALVAEYRAFSLHRIVSLHRWLWISFWR